MYRFSRPVTIARSRTDAYRRQHASRDDFAKKRLTFQRWQALDFHPQMSIGTGGAMITVQVNDMTCGHCAAAIEEAVAAVDALARLEIDLPSHRVQIQTRDANADSVLAAIREAGYTPEIVVVDAAKRTAADVSMPRPCRHRMLSLDIDMM
jgi:copper chaperone CopZ